MTIRSSHPMTVIPNRTVLENVARLTRAVFGASNVSLANEQLLDELPHHQPRH